MMTTQTKPLKTSEAITKIMIANLIIILIFMFAPHTESLATASVFFTKENRKYLLHRCMDYTTACTINQCQHGI